MNKDIDLRRVKLKIRNSLKDIDYSFIRSSNDWISESMMSKPLSDIKEEGFKIEESKI